MLHTLSLVKPINNNQSLSRIDKAKELDHLAKGSIFQLVSALKQINDEELFIELGYATMKDYCVKSLNYNLQTAYQYLQISQSFGLYDTSYNFKLEGLSFHKLLDLSRLPQTKIDILLQNDEVKLNNKTLTLEKIKETSREGLRKIINASLEATETAPQSRAKAEKSLLSEKVAIKNNIDKFMKIVGKSHLSDDALKELAPIWRNLINWRKKYIEETINEQS